MNFHLLTLGILVAVFVLWTSFGLPFIETRRKRRALVEDEILQSACNRIGEAEWRACIDPQRMLRCLDGDPYQQELTLFGCACCRRVWSLLEDSRSRDGVEMRERYVRGFASDEELNDAEQNARIARSEIRKNLFHVAEESPQVAPAWAAGAAANAAVGNYHAASDLAARASACATVGVWEVNYNAERANQCDLLRSMIAYPGLQAHGR